MAGADQLQAERLDEGRLADAGHSRNADPERVARRRRQRGQQSVGALAVVGAARLEQGDRLGDRATLRLARRASTLLRRTWSSRGSIATRPGVQAWAAASARLICSSTSLALAGIGVPGP